MNLIERDGERAAIQLGLEQARRGAVRPIEEFDVAFRKQKGVYATTTITRSGKTWR